jgi:serine/threonine protein kinase/formylglycine-generating enzyme required for sulfatase activity
MKECTKCQQCYDDECAFCPVDEKPLITSLTGNVVIGGRYILERRLGKGGMGIVYKAKHKFLKSAYAVKVILPDLVEQNNSLLVRFNQEAVLAASIDHPNVIRVTDFGVEDEMMPYLVMEYLNGDPLSFFLEPDKPLSTGRALEFFKPIALGVAEAHRKGIVHRDLKPQNIIVQKGLPLWKAIKVLDFGLAKIKSAESLGSLIQAQTMSFLGSPHYMSPEQWENQPIDHRADIYALGIILFQMLAGKLPFEGDTIPSVMYRHLMMPPPSFASLGLQVPPEVEAVVQRVLEKVPGDRPNSVEEMFRDLEKAAAQSGLESNSHQTLNFRPADTDAVTIIEDHTDQLSESLRDRLYTYFDSAEKPEGLADTQLAQEFLEAQERVEKAKIKANEADQLVQELAEAQRYAEEAQAKALEAKKRVEEDVRQRIQTEMEQKLAAEQEARQKAEAEALRLGQEAEARKEAEERANQLAQAALEAQNLAEQERQKRVQEARQRELEEGVRRQAEIAASRLAEQVAEAKQKYEEAQREAAREAEQRRLAEMKRQKIESELQAIAQNETERRKLIEAEAQEQIQEQASRFEREARLAEQRVEEASRLAEIEAQKRAEAEAARLRAEEEARRLAIEIAEAQKRFEEYKMHVTADASASSLDESNFPPCNLASGGEEMSSHSIGGNAQNQQSDLSPTILPSQAGNQSGFVSISAETNPPVSTMTSEIHPVSSNENIGQLLTVGSTPKRKSRLLLTAAALFGSFFVLLVGGLSIYFLVLPKTDIASSVNDSDATSEQKNANEITPSAVSRIDSKMVLINGGSFMMGRSDIPDKNDGDWGTQYPAHSVSVNPFYLDKTEVSNEEYAEFVAATGHPIPAGWSDGKPLAGQEKLPVTNVSLTDANAFAEWISKREGKTCRIPTEAEWEYAARNGSQQTSFPWGNDWREGAANVATEKVTEIGANADETGNGIKDLLGNVLEWTSSRFALYPKHGGLVKVSKDSFVVRGGSFYKDQESLEYSVWLTTRRQAVKEGIRSQYLGFRLACTP